MDAHEEVLRSRMDELDELIRRGEEQINCLLLMGLSRWAEGIFNDLLVLERQRDRIAARL